MAIWLTVVNLLQPVVAIALIDRSAEKPVDGQYPLYGNPIAIWGVVQQSFTAVSIVPAAVVGIS